MEHETRIYKHSPWGAVQDQMDSHKLQIARDAKTGAEIGRILHVPKTKEGKWDTERGPKSDLGLFCACVGLIEASGYCVDYERV